MLVSLSVKADIALDLMSAFKLALTKTETDVLGEKKLEQAEAKIDQAQANFFPTVNFAVNYQEQEKIATSSSNLLKSGFMGRKQTYSKINFTQSLYDGNKDWLSLSLAKQDRVVVKHNLSKVSYDLYLMVANNFYTILSLNGEIENLKKMVKLASDRMQEVRSRVKIGKSRSVEVAALEAQLSILAAQIMAKEGELVTAWDQFTLTTGVDKNVKLVDGNTKLNTPDKIENYLAKIESRSDITALKVGLSSMDNKVKIAKAGHYPTLALGGNYYTSRDIGGKNPDWDVALMVTFPLFSGGTVNSDVKVATAQKAESEILLTEKRREAEIEIRTAYNNLVSSLNQIKALESALSFTEQNYKEQEANYRFGQATNLDVISALNTFFDTKRSLDKMRFSALISLAKLKAVTEEVAL